MKKLAIFASGGGSNFQAIVDAVKRGEVAAEIVCLIADREGAKVLERAERESIPALLFRLKDFQSKEEYEEAILTELKARSVEWIALAGYMKIVGSTLLQAYEGRMINLHPSLLPAFPGKDAIGDALSYGVKVTGVTVHFVDEGVDTGPIIAQATVPLHAEDDRETLAQRIHAEEHRLFPQVLQWICEDRVHVEDRKVRVRKD